MPPLWVWAIFASRQHIFSHRQSSAWGRYILPMIKRPLEFTVSVIPVRLYCIKSLCLWNLKTEILVQSSDWWQPLRGRETLHSSRQQFEEREQLWWPFFVPRYGWCESRSRCATSLIRANNCAWENAHTLIDLQKQSSHRASIALFPERERSRSRVVTPLPTERKVHTGCCAAARLTFCKCQTGKNVSSKQKSFDRAGHSPSWTLYQRVNCVHCSHFVKCLIFVKCLVFVKCLTLVKCLILVQIFDTCVDCWHFVKCQNVGNPSSSASSPFCTTLQLKSSAVGKYSSDSIYLSLKLCLYIYLWLDLPLH